MTSATKELTPGTVPLRLYTFSLSHFSEKIRWTLAASGIPFQEVPWTPFFHVLPARRRGKGTTVPVLEAGADTIQDSTRILHWLERHRSPFALLPTDPSERERALAIEARFDEVGDDVVRYAYSTILDDAESVVRFWTTDATPRQHRVIRRYFPVMRWIFRRKLGLGPARVARARETIASGLAWLEAEIAGGAAYLVGGRLSVADLTAAALLAPLACPEEHPVYGSAPYRASIAPLVAEWRDAPGLAWVRQTYTRHRGVWPRFAELRGALEGAANQ